MAPFEDRPLSVSIAPSKDDNTTTYLFGFDLPHSLMVIGMMMALATICVALFINFKVRKKPELLDQTAERRQGMMVQSPSVFLMSMTFSETLLSTSSYRLCP